MADVKRKGKASIEDALLRELRFSGMDKENLKELVGIVAGLQRAGLKRLKAFPQGIPQLVDALQVSGTVEADDVNQFLANILTKTPRLGGIKVFPLGIPFPEAFEVNIEIGAPIKARGIRES